ncbi:MAG: DUF998 domain-containing protein [Thermoanaerobaculia bacterium]|nr:MAG: DUF998 domain-containing protein [Thermoanaerobaculia bacterium]
MKRRVIELLLVSGILSPLLYVASDITMAFVYDGYSYLHQTISELNAIGAPTRTLSIGLGLMENVLLILYGIGIWIAAARNRRLEVAAGALVILGVFGCWALPFASMQMRGRPQEGPHLLSGAIGALLVVTAIGFAAAAFGSAFRRYSAATIAVMLIFATWAAMDAERIGAGAATPWVGAIERVSFYSWHVWFMVLAIALLRGWGGRLARSSH